MHLTDLKGIGEKRLAQLNKMGVFTVEDLLSVLPHTYQDGTAQKRISDLQNGESALLCVTVTSAPSVRYIKKGLNMTACNCKDETGNATLVWFNQPYRAKDIAKDGKYTVFGKVSFKKDKIYLINPVFEKADENLKKGIFPVYRLPAKSTISQKLMRQLITQAIALFNKNIPDLLPEEFRKEYNLADLDFSICNIHFPSSFDALAQAKRRLAFEDLLKFLMAVNLHKEQVQKQTAQPFSMPDILDENFKKCIPFPLTGAQLKCMQEIKTDLTSGTVMNRLIQGDVGSGKTVLAFYALYAAVKNGGQAALMAPTDVLAKQHYTGFLKYFPDINAVHVSGGMNKGKRDEVLAQIKGGEAKVIIGTHALLEKDVEFNNLKLVVTDEQHRFGVAHRAAISSKGQSPHVLVMSATPIPRTLTLILYSDLSLSVLDELPKGRKEIKTHIIPPEKEQDLYSYIRRCAQGGQQSYIVCPLIEESESIPCISAEDMYKNLKENALKDVPVALLHGKLSPKEKDAIMDAFAKNEIKVLISTTVIEVGINVPNAINMVIAGADRFGLATLHQLRGRVGRGDVQSYCFLLTNTQSATALKRLSILTTTNNGFVIAEKDLQLRGPGDYLGTRQSGIPSTRYAQILSDMPMLREAQDALNTLLNTPKYQKHAQILLNQIKANYSGLSHIVYN